MTRRSELYVGFTLVLLAVVSAGATAQDAAGQNQSGKEAAKKISTVATITLKGSVPESSGEIGLFGEMSQNLSVVVDRLNRAATDKDLSAVVIKLRSPSLGRGRVAELSAAIERIKAEGKHVIADLESASSADYQLACTCDEIIMPESGTLMIPGVRAEVMFYKGLLDKLGVQADMMQVGDYKGAAEPMTRKGMSDAFRRQYEGLLGDIYDQMVSKIAEARDLKADQVKKLIDRGLFTAADARQAGLIDHVVYADQFQRDLKTKLDVDEIKLAKDYGKKKVDTDFSGMLGMMKMFELMMGIKPATRSSARNKVAVIYAVGSIMTGESLPSLFGGQVLGSDSIVKALREANDNKRVVAIVLRVDSPGGSALASDLIWREIQRIEKPVIASMGDTAASGGYYISMGCDKIYALPGTLTGSIGVVGGKIATKGLFDKVGLNTEVISRGENSGLFSMNESFSESERTAWKAMMEEIYQQFVSKAAAGRKMKVADLEPLAGGRVWTGRQAKQNGLVDELGTLRDAIAAAKAAAGIKESEKVEVLPLPKPANIFDQLLGLNTTAPIQGARRPASVGSAPAQFSSLLTGDERLLGELELLQTLFKEPALLWLPYRLRIQ